MENILENINNKLLLITERKDLDRIRHAQSIFNAIYKWLEKQEKKGAGSIAQIKDAHQMGKDTYRIHLSSTIPRWKKGWDKLLSQIEFSKKLNRAIAHYQPKKKLITIAINPNSPFFTHTFENFFDVFIHEITHAYDYHVVGSKTDWMTKVSNKLQNAKLTKNQEEFIKTYLTDNTEVNAFFIQAAGSIVNKIDKFIKERGEEKGRIAAHHTYTKSFDNFKHHFIKNSEATKKMIEIAPPKLKKKLLKRIYDIYITVKEEYKL